MLQTFIEYFLLQYMNIESVMYTHAHISEKKPKEYFYDCSQLSEIFME